VCGVVEAGCQCECFDGDGRGGELVAITKVDERMSNWIMSLCE
jgi:hypothetical protein